MSTIDLSSLSLKGQALYRGDEAISSYQGDVVLTGDPDVVVRARDTQEVAEILAYAHAHSIPVTFMGGQSGLTGACAATSGIVIATEKLDKIKDIGSRNGQAFAIAEPGIFLGELKSQVAEEKLFYPPDPTSYREARLGGTIATNATGEDTLLYGPTRRYIRGLKVVQADGTIQEFERPLDDRPPLEKGTAGYTRSDPPIDLFIGSEGTLGYVAEVTVDLLEQPHEHWAAIAFFPSLETALNFVVSSLKSEAVKPRALELMDRRSLDYFKTAQDVPTLANQAQAAIYWKQEYANVEEQAQGQEAWYQLYNQVCGNEALSGDCIWIAESPSKQDLFRRWRHHIPSTINEEVHHYREVGGGKVSTDWWVPPEHIQEALAVAIKESQQLGLEPIIFGHIGNGHPHINYLACNDDEKAKGMQLIAKQCQRAVEWGGGVAGEHGLGKIHRDLLAVQHSKKVIDQMIAIKRHWDPNWILGRGTLFEVPEEFL